LILQADPELSPNEVEALLLRTARQLPSPEGSNAIGAGGIDLRGLVGTSQAHDGRVP
jgi:hypothetical protein